MPHTHSQEQPYVVHDDNGGNTVGLVIGIIFLVLVGLFLLFYGLPYISGSSNRSTNVNIPDKVDVNLNK